MAKIIITMITMMNIHDNSLIMKTYAFVEPLKHNDVDLKSGF